MSGERQQTFSLEEGEVEKAPEGEEGKEETPPEEGERLGAPRADGAGEDVDVEEEAEAQRALREVWRRL